MADSSTFVQSVENQQHNVDLCIYSALAKSIEENRQNSLFCQVYFILWTAFFWALMKVFNWLSITQS